jgi:hypothetical protein
VSEIILGT